MRNENLKWIRRTECRTYRGGTDAHLGGGHPVEAESPRENQQGGDEADDLLLHVLERAAGGEGDADDRHRQNAAIAEPAHERVDAIAERAGAVDHTEGASHEKDEGDDGGGIDDPVGNRHQCFEGPERMWSDRVIRARGHNTSSRGGVVVAVELARGQDVCEHRRDNRAPDHQGKRVRQAESHGSSVM